MKPETVDGLGTMSEIITEVQKAEFKHGRRRDKMKDYLSDYVHVEEIETMCHIGLEIHLEGDLKYQTGTVRDLVKGTKDRWHLRDIRMGDNDMWQIEVIIVDE